MFIELMRNLGGVEYQYDYQTLCHYAKRLQPIAEWLGASINGVPYRCDGGSHWMQR